MAGGDVIKINPYEIPEILLELISSICTAKDTSNIMDYWFPLKDIIEEKPKGKNREPFNLFFTNNRNKFYDIDFYSRLINLLGKISLDIRAANNAKCQVTIAVAGGFNAGKSTFLNSLIGINDLLPMDSIPTTALSTYIYCSKHIQNIAVKGVNHKNVVVDLDKAVLGAIKHNSPATRHLASVIDKLFIEIPVTTKELDGIAFIDTPGYNNSDTANVFNGKTDKESALQGIGDGSFLLWLVNAQKTEGSIPEDDINLIKQFKGKKAIMLNKVASKPKEWLEETIDIMYDELEEELGEDLVDVFAYDGVTQTMYYSYNNFQLFDIIKYAKKTVSSTNRNLLIKQVGLLFEDEIDKVKQIISEYDKLYKEKVKKDKEYDITRTNKNTACDSTLAKAKATMVDSYNQICEDFNKLSEYSKETNAKWKTFIRKVDDYIDGRFTSPSTSLTSALSESKRKHTESLRIYETLKTVPTISSEERVSQFESVEDTFSELKSAYETHYIEQSKSTQNVLIKRDQLKNHIKLLRKYKDDILRAITIGIRAFELNREHSNEVTIAKSGSSVFETIRNNDYLSFLKCFTNGVALKSYNSEGFSPLTYAVHCGNNSMVKFLLEVGANPRDYDERGMNAMHTAVENQYRDICEMLLSYDKSLLNIANEAGESLFELSDRFSFSNWIKQLTT